MSIAQVMMRPGRRGAIARRMAAFGPLATVAAVCCFLLVLVAVFGWLIAPYDATAIDPLAIFDPSSPAHWLGTDDTGRDILSRLIIGAGPSLAGPALVVVLSAIGGTLLAILAAWHGGWVDAMIARFIEVTFAVPGLILAVVAAAVFGTGFLAPVIALSISYVPVLARVLRAAALKERSLPYIEALRVQGASGWTICVRHLLPNILPLIVVQSAVAFGYAMLDLAAVSYLGLGIQPPAPDWGVMVANGQPSIIGGYPEQSLYAALVIVLAVVGFNLVGERLARHFDIEGRT
ncbi:peptide/nickel transport system permease protein [Kibdelosporangium banguiense]|uniref:Peptide/nickel transport system permease protein n=1 Tax=Kibdelosporangium banguiense TaxID=1365924 RepID=A0ABS4TZ95_9PSEU|nr:ABC transporter permease [Kibdelosporangium banguiense]MBP2329274.1 peptide/nickel transport system permease protein [Kibdelosporangium banguiense]